MCALQPLAICQHMAELSLKFILSSWSTMRNYQGTQTRLPSHSQVVHWKRCSSWWSQWFSPLTPEFFLYSLSSLLENHIGYNYIIFESTRAPYAASLNSPALSKFSLPYILNCNFLSSNASIYCFKSKAPISVVSAFTFPPSSAPQSAPPPNGLSSTWPLGSVPPVNTSLPSYFNTSDFLDFYILHDHPLSKPLDPGYVHAQIHQFLNQLYMSSTSQYRPL